MWFVILVVWCRYDCLQFLRWKFAASTQIMCECVWMIDEITKRIHTDISLISRHWVIQFGSAFTTLYKWHCNSIEPLILYQKSTNNSILQSFESLTSQMIRILILNAIRFWNCFEYYSVILLFTKVLKCQKKINKFIDEKTVIPKYTWPADTFDHVTPSSKHLLQTVPRQF